MSSSSPLSADRLTMSILGSILANQAAIMAALSHLDVPVNAREQLAILNEKALKLAREIMP